MSKMFTNDKEHFIVELTIGDITSPDFQSIVLGIVDQDAIEQSRVWIYEDANVAQGYDYSLNFLASDQKGRLIPDNDHRIDFSYQLSAPYAVDLAQNIVNQIAIDTYSD